MWKLLKVWIDPTLWVSFNEVFELTYSREVVRAFVYVGDQKLQENVTIVPLDDF